MEKLRALIIAEACNPEWVSVPLEGWSHSRALARLADTHLVTQIRNQPAIERAGLTEGRDFTAIDSEKIAGPLEKIAQKVRGGQGKGWTTIMAMRRFGFSYFEKKIWERFGDDIRQHRFDVVHQLTPLSPTIPSRLATWCKRAGVPFIWGPINGGLAWPRGFDDVRRQEKEWLTYVRSAIKLLPGYSRTRRDCSAIIVGSQATLSQMPDRFKPKCVYIPENAVDPARFPIRRSHRAGLPICLIFVGRLVPYKGADMLIEAASALLKSGKLHLKLVGDGPQKPELEKLIAQHNLQSSIEFAGWIDHKNLPRHYSESDVFAFPSIREFGGAVALEAMACGVPAVVADYGGLGELVTDETGWLLPMGRRSELIERLRGTLESIVDDPQSIDRKGLLAYERVMTHFTWDAKARQVVEVWKGVLGR